MKSRVLLKQIETLTYNTSEKDVSLLCDLKDKVRRMGGQQENALNINEEPQHDEYEPLAEPVERPPFQEISNFREPLLAYLDN